MLFIFSERVETHIRGVYHGLPVKEMEALVNSKLNFPKVMSLAIQLLYEGIELHIYGGQFESESTVTELLARMNSLLTVIYERTTNTAP